jgi:hypothetical protein
MNKGNQRVGEAAGFKISFISQVGKKNWYVIKCCDQFIIFLSLKCQLYLSDTVVPLL